MSEGTDFPLEEILVSIVLTANPSQDSFAFYAKILSKLTQCVGEFTFFPENPTISNRERTLEGSKERS